MVVGTAAEHQVGPDGAGGHDDLDAVVGLFDLESRIGEAGLVLGLELPADLGGAPRDAVVDVDRLAVHAFVPITERAGELVLDLLDVGRDDDQRPTVRGVRIAPETGEKRHADEDREGCGSGNECGPGSWHGRSV